MYAGRVNADSGVWRWPRRPAPRRRRRSRPDRSISFSTAWRAVARRDPAQLCRRSGSHSRRSENEALDGHAEIMRWLLLTPIVQSMTVFELWDDDAFHALATRAVRLARETGALALLPVALVYRSGVHLFGGEFVAAEALVQEADAIAVATGNASLLYAWLLVGAWRGVEAEAMEFINAGLEEHNRAIRGQGRGSGRLCHRRSQQRLGSLRGRHRRCQASQRRR